MQEVTSKLNQLLERKRKLVEDSILINDRAVPVERENFVSILPGSSDKILAFVDGGNAELFNSEDICLQFVRVVAVFFQNNKRLSKEKKVSFFLLSQTNEEAPEEYPSQFFWEEGKLPLEEFSLNALELSLREGAERGKISKAGELARRKAELLLASEVSSEADWVVLDGTLEEKLPGEKEIIEQLPENVCALAKSCSWITAGGRNAASYINLIGPPSSWAYFLSQEKRRKTFFVKLNGRSNYVFRFETFSGNKEILELLVANSVDPIFIGYPYSLIYADQRARVSNQETAMMKAKLSAFLKRKEHLHKAHEILDRIKF